MPPDEEVFRWGRGQGLAAPPPTLALEGGARVANGASGPRSNAAAAGGRSITGRGGLTGGGAKKSGLRRRCLRRRRGSGGRGFGPSRRLRRRWRRSRTGRGGLSGTAWGCGGYAADAGARIAGRRGLPGRGGVSGAGRAADRRPDGRTAAGGQEGPAGRSLCRRHDR